MSEDDLLATESATRRMERPKKVYYRKVALVKRVDPERMPLKALEEALCSYAGPKGERCPGCRLCAYGTNWIKRRATNEL